MKQNGITRRQALLSLASASAGLLLKPSSIFCSPVNDKVRFAVIGDWGTGDRHQLEIAKLMYAAHQSTPFDFVISAGDNVYPNGAGRHFDRSFERPFGTFVKDRVNFYTVLGNHDVEAGRQDQCQYPMFNMGGQCYYKFGRNNGMVEFFMLDSTDFSNTQANWLENSLRDSKAKWKIATFHHPIYSSGKHHGSAMGLRKQLEPIFTRYHVNVAFSGHDHIYERTSPQQGVQYFVTGAAGKCNRGDIDRKSGITAASFDDSNHFMVVEIGDNKINFQAVSENGEVVDKGLVEQAAA